MDKLNIIPGEDHVTLTTCTPYGVNSHRLLVRAKRVETADDTKSVSKITADAVQLDSLVVVPFVAIPLFVVRIRGEQHSVLLSKSVANRIQMP